MPRTRSLADTAKFNPWLSRVPKELTPISCSSSARSGPPELPGVDWRLCLNDRRSMFDVVRTSLHS